MNQIEGEDTGLLRDVIVSQAVELKREHGEYGPDGLLPQISCREAKETMASYADGCSRRISIC